MNISVSPRPDAHPIEDLPDVPDPPPAPDPPFSGVPPAPLSENILDEMHLSISPLDKLQNIHTLKDSQRGPTLTAPPLPLLPPPPLPPTSHPEFLPDETKIPVPAQLTLSPEAASNVKAAEELLSATQSEKVPMESQEQEIGPVKLTLSSQVAQPSTADASAPSSARSPAQPPTTLKDLPPPQFSSVPDVSSVWPETIAGPSTTNASGTVESTDDKSDTKISDEVAWNRPAAAGRSTKEAAEPAPTTTPQKPPLLQRVKVIVCQLPDPTLFFLAEAVVMLALHAVRPDLLRTWTARIIAPLLLLPTIAMTALWRPTHVVPLPGRAVLNPIKPIPNAAGVVEKGAALRSREAAVVAAEAALEEGQRKLEMLRQEVQRKLPPAASISNMLASENHTDVMPATAPPLTQ